MAKNQQQNTTTNQKCAGDTKEGKDMRRLNGGGGLRGKDDTIVLGTLELGEGVKTKIKLMSLIINFFLALLTKLC